MCRSRTCANRPFSQLCKWTNCFIKKQTTCVFLCWDQSHLPKMVPATFQVDEAAAGRFVNTVARRTALCCGDTCSRTPYLSKCCTSPPWSARPQGLATICIYALLQRVFEAGPQTRGLCHVDPKNAVSFPGSDAGSIWAARPCGRSLLWSPKLLDPSYWLCSSVKLSGHHTFIPCFRCIGIFFSSLFIYSTA